MDSEKEKNNPVKGEEDSGGGGEDNDSEETIRGEAETGVSSSTPEVSKK